jgi:hypothetical protein
MAMADVVVLRADCRYNKNSIRISCITGTIGADYGGMLYADLAQALKYLLEDGYRIIQSDGDASGFNYTLIREPDATEPIREELEERVNTTVTIETDAGPVTGVLVLIGTDAITIEEPGGTTVIIPIRSVNAVS